MTDRRSESDSRHEEGSYRGSVDSEFARTVGGTGGVAFMVAVAVAAFTGWHFGLVLAVLTVVGLGLTVPQELERARREAAFEAAPKRVVQCGAMLVEFTNVGGHTTWRFLSTSGPPHMLAHEIAQEELTRQQLAAGEPPWFPDVAERLRGNQA